MPVTYCGRTFSDGEMDRIRELAAAAPNRRVLSLQICRELGWLQINGNLKDMSCRAALLRMHRAGLITLPAPLHAVGPMVRAVGDAPVGFPVRGSRGDIARLTLDPVTSRAESRSWGDLVARHHYLGYYPLPGAQIRYFIHGDGVLLGLAGFSAAAWKIAPRDGFIGWSPDQRKARLHLVVNNARLLLLPWVSVRFLASSALALAARQLPGDWSARFAYRPVLLETFVDSARFAGTCYRAANWVRVGQTQGRGKLDRHHRAAEPIKDVYLYPLTPRFRDVLTAPLPAPAPLPTLPPPRRETHATE